MSDKARTTAPDEIYLQGYVGSFHDGDVTWCDHRIEEDDTRYLRVPLIARDAENEAVIKRFSTLLAEIHLEAGGELVTGETAAAAMNTLVERVRTLRLEVELHRSQESDKRAIRNAALDDAAKVVADHNREGRGWIPGSLWDTLANEAAARVMALKEPQAGPALG